MPSLHGATSGLGPCQSSDCETINGQGAPITHWHLGHSLCQWLGCLQRTHQSQSFLQHPLLSTQDTLALYGYPWALSARLRGQPPNWWSLRDKGILIIWVFCIFLCIQPFGPYSYYWKPNTPIGANHSLDFEAQQLLSECFTWCLGQTGLRNA